MYSTFEEGSSLVIRRSSKETLKISLTQLASQNSGTENDTITKTKDTSQIILS